MNLRKATKGNYAILPPLGGKYFLFRAARRFVLLFLAGCFGDHAASLLRYQTNIGAYVVPNSH
jgi:hypothetical protein